MTGERWQPSGIKGLEGRPSAGASVQIGRRDKPKGMPVERDRFHILEPHERSDQMRHPHPDFGFFNDAAPEKRQVIGGIIAHGTWDYTTGGCLEQHRSAAKLPGKPSPPSREPACVGDGTTARRWMGDGWQPVPCTDRCPFLQPVDDRNGPPCKPLTRLLFRLDWTGTPAAGKAPTPIVRFASGGFYTYTSIAGLKVALDDAARALGINPATVSPFGLRFRLQVQERTKPGKKFPAVIATLVDSAADHILRVMKQRDEIQRLAADAPRLAIGDDSYADDVRSLTVEGR